jgi:hypothetical protein
LRPEKAGVDSSILSLGTTNVPYSHTYEEQFESFFLVSAFTVFLLLSGLAVTFQDCAQAILPVQRLATRSDEMMRLYWETYLLKRTTMAPMTSPFLKSLFGLVG